MAPTTTEHQGSFLSRISIRRNQIVSMDVNNHDHDLRELDSFQKHVAERFSELISPSPSPHDPILSISWLGELLDAFMSCEAEFKMVLITGHDPSMLSKHPLDRVVLEMLDRIVKALDICNAAVNGVDSARHCQRLAEIAVTALKQRPLTDGSVRRAKRALSSLLKALNVEERDRNSGGGRKTQRSWSFSRHNGGGDHTSCKSWSAAKQIHAMAANLVAPRSAEASGLALPIYIISTITVLVMWVLVAALPCQASNDLATHLHLLLNLHLNLPKQQSWASAAVNINERVIEEMKRKEKHGVCGLSGGLMEEMQRMERIGIELMGLAEGFRFLSEEEVAEKVAEMEEVCRKMEGLLGLQRKMRQVFHRLVRSRIQILHALDQAGKNSAPAL